MRNRFYEYTHGHQKLYNTLRFNDVFVNERSIEINMGGFRARWLTRVFLFIFATLILGWLITPERLDRNINSLKMLEMGNRVYRDVFLDLLKTFIEIADELELVWFIHYGTLIGSWRHHGFVPWDDDIDIIVNISQKDALLSKIKSMNPYYMGEDGIPIVKFYSNRSTLKVPKSYHKWPFIDILFFEEDDDAIWDNLRYMNNIHLQKSDVFPLHKRPFEGFLVNSPRRPMKLLVKIFHSSDPVKCATGEGSHRPGRDMPSVEVTCEALKNIFPFVHRESVDNIMKETLKLGDRALHTKYVDEEKDSLTLPYSFKPVNYVPGLLTRLEYLLHLRLYIT
ncbi:uncharacterized protein LOC135500632 [Lineus longissimus]|uniref:uncharacterized protein LOC135500632 n=1 Tax=Lineus longissimus TaxID=88925 RepID=UPI00315DA4D1